MLIGTTTSVCPVCLRTIPAQKVVGPDDFVYLNKTCPKHGDFSTLIWEGCSCSYLGWGKDSTVTEPPIAPRSIDKGCPYDCGLCEEHERKGCCVLLELTNRCNLRCPVCFASAGEQVPYDLPLEEIEKQYDYLMNHGGPFNIQLSGGEPTMRDDLPAIIRMGRQKGFSFFQLNTNGLRLAGEPGYAQALKEAGLNTVFLQFDGLTDEVYRVLRGRPLLSEKMQAIRHCEEAGLGIVLVPVIAPDVNEDQIGNILRFALEQMPAVRGVHFQPISYFGRCGLEAPRMRITIPRMLHHIEAQTNGLMKQVDFGGGGAENPYCSFHASYLKKCDGTLKSLAQKNSQCCCTTSDDSRNFVADQWSGNPSSEPSCCCIDADKPADTDDCCQSMVEVSSLDQFLEDAKKNTLAVSGMIFQDAYNLDLDRLHRCYICEIDSRYGMVPFCAYNLTDTNGKALYRS